MEIINHKGKYYLKTETGYREILASTNKSLGYEESIYDPRSKTGGKWIVLPQPSQSFIEKYVEEYNKGNIITDVMVEYDEFIPNNGINLNGGYHTGLKINPKDNTIIISKCKDSWSREEVIELMQKSIIYGTELEAGAIEVDWKIDYKLKWIEDNL